MDMLLTELVLWGGLLLLFWAMKDSLGKIETDITARALKKNSFAHAQTEFTTPDDRAELIGQYRDTAIYRYVMIGHQRYCFDHIQLAEEEEFLPENKRCIAPGLVYVRCDTVSGSLA